MNTVAWVALKGLRGRKRSQTQNGGPYGFIQILYESRHNCNDKNQNGVIFGALLTRRGSLGCWN
jgi:hypothetical protein